jgi:hypothetical protein
MLCCTRGVCVRHNVFSLRPSVMCVSLPTYKKVLDVMLVSLSEMRVFILTKGA